MVRLDAGPAIRQATLALLEHQGYAEPNQVDLVHRATLTGVAELVGVSARTVHRWKRDGLSARQADRLAVALGFHPLHLWPEWGSAPWAG